MKGIVDNQEVIQFTCSLVPMDGQVAVEGRELVHEAVTKRDGLFSN